MGPKLYYCSRCPAAFTRKFNTERHEETAHRIIKNTIKPFNCSICKSKFSHKRSLTWHLKKVHSENSGDSHENSSASHENSGGSHENSGENISSVNEEKIDPDVNDCEQSKVHSESSGDSHENSGENIFSGHEEKIDLDANDCEQLKELLPPCYDYTVREYQRKENAFTAKFTFQIKATNEVDTFVDAYSAKFKERYILKKVEKWEPKNTCLILKKSYACHHCSQKKSEKNRKNTNCPRRLYISVSPNGESFRCDVSVTKFHNHYVDNAAALKLLKPSPEVIAKFEKLFQAGLSPSKALERHELDLTLEYGDESYIALADRSICPDLSWVFHQYYNIFKKNYGEAHGEEMLASLKKAVTEINAGNDASVKLVTHQNSFTLAVMTSLMKRVCETPLAADITFVDSTGGVDRYGCRVFLIFVLSCCGGLPAGALITTSESEEAITEALESYKSLLSDKSFGGKGLSGPAYFMTDDCDGERNALKNAFPLAALLLCIFHVLQAIWRWLLDGHNQIKKDDRPALFRIMKELIYCTKDDLESKIKNLDSMDIVKTYPNYRTYIERWLNKKEAWALCLRKSESLRGHNTNNIIEAAMRVLKEKVLERLKSYSPVQLLDYLVKDFSSFYEKKLLKVAVGRPPSYLKKKAKKVKFDERDYEVKLIDTDNSIYEVQNLKNKKTYELNLDLFLCTCPVGDTGGICKHYYITKKLCRIKKHILNLPENENDKKFLHYIALGKTCEKENWYSDLMPQADRTIYRSTDSPIAEISNPQNPLVTSKNGEMEVEMPEKNEIDIIEKEMKIAEKLGKFEASLSKINDIVKQNPENYFNAIDSFCKTVDEKIKTEASMVSALHCFGKFNGMKNKLRKAGRIGVQSTAISRRKTLCGGRGNLQSGRPPKWALAPEHAYIRNEELRSALPQFKKKQKAPHNLAFCVEENISLGKSH